MGSCDSLRILEIIGGLLALVVFILNIVFSFKYSEYTFNSNNIISEIDNSLSGTLITDFSLKYRCSDDEEKVYLGEWDGTVKGCECPNKVSRGYCSRKQRSCVNITSISPKEYKYFKEKSICIKRSNIKYMDLLKNKQILEKNSTCPIGYESCGIIDTKDRILCLKSKSECPINISYIKNKYSNYFHLEYNNDDLKDDNEKIIGLFKLNEGQPCMNPDEKTWYYHYILEDFNKECKTKIDGKLYDYNYEPLLNTTKYDLYQDNDIYTKNLYKTELKNEYIFLYGKGFLGLNPEDVGDYSKDSLVSIQKVSNNCNSVMKVFSYIFLAFLCLPVLVCCGMCCGKRNSNVDAGGCLIMFGLIGLLISSVITFLIDFILAIIIFACSIKFNSILNVQGNDPYINELFKILSDEQNSKNFVFSLFIMILSILTIIVGILIILCRLINGDSKGYSSF